LSTNDAPAHVKAHATGRGAETVFRNLTSRVAVRWKFISFRGLDNGEWVGVVDLVAIRKDTRPSSGNILKRGDLFDIILIQIKGGSARSPTESDCRRLREVKRVYRARSIVQFQWRKGESSRFFVLDRNQWKRATSQELFGETILDKNRRRGGEVCVQQPDGSYSDAEIHEQMVQGVGDSDFIDSRMPAEDVDRLIDPKECSGK
jgi:hypothetical protein